jgi:hypothetical protein
LADFAAAFIDRYSKKQNTITEMRPGTLAARPNCPPVSQSADELNTGLKTPEGISPLTPNPKNAAYVQFAIKWIPKGIAGPLQRFSPQQKSLRISIAAYFNSC